MSKIIPTRPKRDELQPFYSYPLEYQSPIKKLRNDRLFIFTVIIPTVVAIIYYTFIASNIYISESRFIVRAQSTRDGVQSAAGGLQGMLSTLGGISTSGNDSLTADNYISSRDALKILNEELHLLDAYTSTSIDRLHRYGGIRFWDKSLESFYEYYLENIISISSEMESGISTLTVRAFTPDLAYKINEKLNDLSEELINRLNDRARQDMLSFSEQEAELAKKKVEQINQKIYAFRNGTMGNMGSANSQITIFQQMASEKDFADRNLAAALAAMEQARIESLKKRLYLEKVTQPNLPDYAVEPKRIRGILSTLLLGLLAWGILSMLTAGIREHHQ